MNSVAVGGRMAPPWEKRVGFGLFPAYRTMIVAESAQA
jgi:hypothetical protein